jgi:hypothetical protein
MMPKPNDEGTPIMKLLDTLRNGFRKNRGKGWHQTELNFGDEGKKRMNAVEEQLMLVEGLKIEMYLSLPNTREIDRKIRGKKLQKFKTRKVKYGPLT